MLRGKRPVVKANRVTNADKLSDDHKGDGVVVGENELFHSAGNFFFWRDH